MKSETRQTLDHLVENILPHLSTDELRMIANRLGVENGSDSHHVILKRISGCDAEEIWQHIRPISAVSLATTHDFIEKSIRKIEDKERQISSLADRNQQSDYDDFKTKERTEYAEQLLVTLSEQQLFDLADKLGAEIPIGATAMDVQDILRAEFADEIGRLAGPSNTWRHLLLEANVLEKHSEIDKTLKPMRSIFDWLSNLKIVVPAILGLAAVIGVRVWSWEKLNERLKNTVVEAESQAEKAVKLTEKAETDIEAFQAAVRQANDDADLAGEKSQRVSLSMVPFVWQDVMKEIRTHLSHVRPYESNISERVVEDFNQTNETLGRLIKAVKPSENGSEVITQDEFARLEAFETYLSKDLYDAIKYLSNGVTDESQKYETWKKLLERTRQIVPPTQIGIQNDWNRLKSAIHHIGGVFALGHYRNSDSECALFESDQLLKRAMKLNPTLASPYATDIKVCRLMLNVMAPTEHKDLVGRAIDDYVNAVKFSQQSGNQATYVRATNNLAYLFVFITDKKMSPAKGNGDRYLDHADELVKGVVPIGAVDPIVFTTAADIAMLRYKRTDDEAEKRRLADDAVWNLNRAVSFGFKQFDGYTEKDILNDYPQTSDDPELRKRMLAAVTDPAQLSKSNAMLELMQRNAVQESK